MYPLVITVLSHCHVSFQGAIQKSYAQRLNVCSYLPTWTVDDFPYTSLCEFGTPKKALGGVSLGVHSHRSSPNIGKTKN